jgi:hypothetical protein
MKVTGPGTGAPSSTPETENGPGAADAAGKNAPTGASGTDKAAHVGRSFAETLAAAPPAAHPARVGGADALTADIAADLEAGKLDPKAALDKVVERVLDRQLGANAPAAVRNQLRDALRDTISGDPFLADRLRGLG